MTIDPVTQAERALAWYAERERLRLHTRDELLEWVEQYLGVRLPRVACCEEHTAPADAFARAYFGSDLDVDGRPLDEGSEPMAVWIGSRGFAGKSYALAALAMVEAATLGAEVRVLGGSADQSENVVRYTETWTRRQAMSTMLSDRRSGREAGVTRQRVRLYGGGMVDALAASTRAVRGPHPTRLRIDEADELDVRILDAAMGQTMAKGGVPAQAVISSTHHYAHGTMTEVLARAADRGWPVFRWCYRCTMRTPDNPTGWLDPDEVARKENEVTKRMFRIEYELQEPTPEGAGLLDPTWFAIVDAAPADFDAIGRSWDEAATKDGGDWTVGAKVGRKDGIWYILDIMRGRWTPAGVDRAIDQCAALDGWQCPILLQQEPGSSGKARVDDHRRRLVSYDVRSAPPTGDKVLRARPMASAAEAGNVRLVKGTWNRAFLDECETFPSEDRGAHDDQVDAVSWAIQQLGNAAQRNAPIAASAMMGGKLLGEHRERVGTYTKDRANR